MTNRKLLPVAERRRRVLRAVWDAWGNGRVLSLREMARIANYRIQRQPHAINGTISKLVAGLVREGWLTASPLDSGRHRYTRGPTLGGVDSNGRIYRVINDDPC